MKMGVEKIEGKTISNVRPGINSLAMFFDDGSRLVLKLEGRVVPRMLYELHIAESFKGVVDDG